MSVHALPFYRKKQKALFHLAGIHHGSRYLQFLPAAEKPAAAGSRNIF